ncbi:pyridoxal-phosphate dependent enzyme [Halopenitus sp. H-Gu1]|uniref:pyridoxal-phosphate dependent enzyme n=1 Tax=Halopenitus sp. H-Gu1 TaxID=3242697 RepID=UPI00359E22B0
METTHAFEGLTCHECGSDHALTASARCRECGGALDPSYDYDAIDPATIRQAPDGGSESTGSESTESPGSEDAVGASNDRDSGLWRFEALLPFPAEMAVSAHEGSTPLVAADRLAAELDVANVFIKDEGRNPTGTVLDRGLSVAMTAVAGLVDADGSSGDGPRGDVVEPLVCASPGNAGQSMAAYAGRTDLRSYAFVPSRCAFSNKAMTNVHGGEMRVVGGRHPDAVAAVDEQLATDYTDLAEFETPFRHEGTKTIAYEIAADLGWTAPDVVVVPVASGEVIAGIAKGFRELSALDLLEDRPRLVAAQPEGCAPIAAALDRGIDDPEPWGTPDTICGELEIPDPEGGAWAVDAVRESDGRGVTASDADILESAVAVAQHEVLEMGAAGGVAPAGAWKLAEDGWFDGDETVVLLNTDSGLKTPDVLRSHLMGKGI